MELFLLILTSIIVATETRPDWGFGDGTAIVGRKFEYKLGDGNFQQTYKISRVVERGTKKLPDWLSYDTNSSLLVGVPLEDDVGMYSIRLKALCMNATGRDCPDKISRSFHISVFDSLTAAERGSKIGSTRMEHDQLSYRTKTTLEQKLKPNSNRELLVHEMNVSPSATLSFYMHDGNSDYINNPDFKYGYSSKVSHSSRQDAFYNSMPFPSVPAEKKVSPPCKPDDVAIYATFVLLIEHRLSGADRVSLLHALSSFISKDVNSLFLSKPETNMFHVNSENKYIFLAGPGNVVASLKDSLEISWHIDCGHFERASNFGKLLQHNVDVGRITSELGYNVLAWYLYSDKQLSKREKRNARPRRFTQTPTFSPPSSTGEVVVSGSIYTVTIPPTSLTKSISETRSFVSLVSSSFMSVSSSYLLPESRPLSSISAADSSALTLLHSLTSSLYSSDAVKSVSNVYTSTSSGLSDVKTVITSSASDIITSSDLISPSSTIAAYSSTMSVYTSSSYSSWLTPESSSQVLSLFSTLADTLLPSVSTIGFITTSLHPSPTYTTPSNSLEDKSQISSSIFSSITPSLTKIPSAVVTSLPSLSTNSSVIITIFPSDTAISSSKLASTLSSLPKSSITSHINLSVVDSMNISSKLSLSPVDSGVTTSAAHSIYGITSTSATPVSSTSVVLSSFSGMYSGPIYGSLSSFTSVFTSNSTAVISASQGVSASPLNTPSSVFTFALSSFSTTISGSTSLSSFSTILSESTSLSSFSTTISASTSLSSFSTTISASTSLSSFSTTISASTPLSSFSTTISASTSLSSFSTTISASTSLSSFSTTISASTSLSSFSTTISASTSLSSFSTTISASTSLSSFSTTIYASTLASASVVSSSFSNISIPKQSSVLENSSSFIHTWPSFSNQMSSTNVFTPMSESSVTSVTSSIINLSPDLTMLSSAIQGTHLSISSLSKSVNKSMATLYSARSSVLTLSLTSEKSIDSSSTPFVSTSSLLVAVSSPSDSESFPTSTSIYTNVTKESVSMIYPSFSTHIELSSVSLSKYSSLFSSITTPVNVTDLGISSYRFSSVSMTPSFWSLIISSISESSVISTSFTEAPSASLTIQLTSTFGVSDSETFSTLSLISSVFEFSYISVFSGILSVPERTSSQFLPTRFTSISLTHSSSIGNLFSTVAFTRGPSTYQASSDLVPSFMVSTSEISHLAPTSTYSFLTEITNTHLTTEFVTSLLHTTASSYLLPTTSVLTNVDYFTSFVSSTYTTLTTSTSFVQHSFSVTSVFETSNYSSDHTVDSIRSVELSSLESTQFLSTVHVPMSSFSTFVNSSILEGHSSVQSSHQSNILATEVTRLSVLPTWTASDTTIQSSSIIPTAAPDDPPVLINPVEELHVHVGRFFEFQVPENTFNDTEDGNARNLSLTARLLYEKPLPPGVWLKFNETRQTFYGIPLWQDVKDMTSKHQIATVTLIAMDTAGQLTRDVIPITYNKSHLQGHAHRISIKFNDSFTKFNEDRSNLIDLGHRLASFYGDSSLKFITILELTTGSITCVWSNNSLSADVCCKDDIQTVFDRLVDSNGSVSDDLVTAFYPMLHPVAAELEFLGICLLPPTTLVPPTKAPVKSDDDNKWVEILLPALIAILIIVIIALVLLVFCRHKRPRKESGKTEKSNFLEDRRPIIFPEELEMVDPSLKPKQPLVLPSDYIAQVPPVPPHQSQEQLPTYTLPAMNDDVFVDGKTASEPSTYGSTGASDPPPYRLPPPYFNPHRNV